MSKIKHIYHVIMDSLGNIDLSASLDSATISKAINKPERITNYSDCEFV